MEPGRKEFSVCQFFEDGSYEYIIRFTDAKVAMNKAVDYTTNVAAKVGITKRVIITDGGDCICFEWKHGEGVTFPQEAA
jgi:hypothetical protein